MNLLDEMLASEEIRDAVERVIVDEDSAEQRLFGLEVVRRGAIGALLRLRLALCELFDGRHEVGASLVSQGLTRTDAKRITCILKLAADCGGNEFMLRNEGCRQSETARSDEKKNSGENRDCLLDCAPPISTRTSGADSLASAKSRARRARSQLYRIVKRTSAAVPARICTTACRFPGLYRSAGRGCWPP